MNKISEFKFLKSDCLKRSAKTFFQAFAAVLLTTLSDTQLTSGSAETTIVKGALTAAVAAGICAVMNIKGGKS